MVSGMVNNVNKVLARININGITIFLPIDNITRRAAYSHARY